MADDDDEAEKLEEEIAKLRRELRAAKKGKPKKEDSNAALKKEVERLELLKKKKDLEPHHGPAHKIRHWISHQPLFSQVLYWFVYWTVWAVTLPLWGTVKLLSGGDHDHGGKKDEKHEKHDAPGPGLFKKMGLVGWTITTTLLATGLAYVYDQTGRVYPALHDLSGIVSLVAFGCIFALAWKTLKSVGGKSLSKGGGGGKSAPH